MPPAGGRRRRASARGPRRRRASTRWGRRRRRVGCAPGLPGTARLTPGAGPRRLPRLVPARPEHGRTSARSRCGGHPALERARRERGREPGLQEVLREEVDRGLLLLEPVRVGAVVGDLDGDRAVLHELLDAGLDRDLHVVDVGAQAGAEVLVDALEIGGDAHVERRLHGGEGQRVDDADGSRALRERGLEQRGALGAQREAEHGVVVAEERRDARTEDLLHRDEGAGVADRGGRAARALQVQRDALHLSRVERHRREPGARGDLRAHAPLDLHGKRERDGEHEEAAARGPARVCFALVLDEAELRPSVTGATRELEMRGEVPELGLVGMIGEDGDALDGAHSRTQLQHFGLLSRLGRRSRRPSWCSRASRA